MVDYTDDTQTTTPETPAPPSPPAEEPTARLSAMERITGVIFSPGETFQDIAKKPTWFMPILVVAIIGALANGVFLMRVDIEEFMVNQLERGGQMDQLSAEQFDQAVTASKYMMYASPVLGAVFLPVILLILTGLFFVSLKIIGGKQTFKQTFSVTSYAFVIQGIKAIVSIPVMFLVNLNEADPKNLLKSNLSAFLPEDSSLTMTALASSVDVFTLWTLIVLAIGFAAISKKSTMASGIVTFAWWFIWVVIVVGLAAVGQKFSS